MRVEIWSDIVCPWCYIGKRRFERALESSGFSSEVEVIWKSFELDPSALPHRELGLSEMDMAERLANKYRITMEQAQASMDNITSLAEAEGLSYRLGSAKQGSSLAAHRLLQLAKLSGMGSQMKEQLFRAYFVNSRDISDPEMLVELASEIGLDRDLVREMLPSDYLTDVVRHDEARAAELGISGVPFFVFESKYGISGAQSSEILLEVLRKVRHESDSIASGTDSSAPDQGGESCPV